MSGGAERDDKIKEFCMITGAGAQVAEQLLSVCNDNLEMAINMHMEGVDVAGTSGNGGPGPSAAASGASPPDDEDEVRAPIPQKQETMIEPGFEGYQIRQSTNRARIRSVFDGFRNFNNEARNSGEEPGEISKGKKRTLEELFKPPLDIMFKGNFQSARDAASSRKKWLLVNIQDAGEFQCQVLNRDVWSSKAVKSVISEHFLFWQVSISRFLFHI